MADLAASVLARLLHRSKQTGEDFQNLLTTYCIERFLHRLGASDLRHRFVLKGAMLLRLWSESPYRATRDLDLSRYGDGNPEAILEDLRVILATLVQADAIDFDGERIRLEAIRAQDEVAGTRATLLARCGKARVTIQVDIGIGDPVWPSPRTVAYPTLLAFPAPEILAYPREAVIAEKFEAMVTLGVRNSRIKDFFDIHHLAENFAFDRVTLVEALRGTFERRRTPVPSEAPIAWTARYWEDPSRSMQIRAFARRAGLSVPEHPESEILPLLQAFLAP